MADNQLTETTNTSLGFTRAAVNALLLGNKDGILFTLRNHFIAECLCILPGWIYIYMYRIINIL